MATQTTNLEWSDGTLLPHCLQEDPFWRAGWELFFHDTCPVHQVWLIDRCSSCRQELHWNRESLLRCGCGADLRQEQSAPSGESDVRLSAILVNKLLGRDGEAVPMPLARANIEQTQQLIRFLGASLRAGVGIKPLKIRQAGAMAASWPISSHAAEVIAHWPQGFHQVLDHFQAQESSRSLKRSLGQTYRYIYVGLKGSAFDPVRLAFEEWLVSSGVVD